MRKPNFFIVGAPRCGTTALYFYLKQHPDVYMCDQKEPYYFSTDFHEESDKYFKRMIRFPIRNKEQYLKLFMEANKEKIVGEGTSEYLYSKEAAKNIYKFNREAKILISVRNPIDFLYSIHSNLISWGGEDILDFKTALDIEPKRLKGNYLPKGLLWPSSLYYSERIKFSEQITRYHDLFSENQVKISIYDDFKKDNLKTYRSVLEFLNVDINFIPHMKILNRNKKPRFNFINRIFAILGDTSVKNIFPITMRKSLRKLNMKYVKRKPLDSNLSRELIIKTSPEVEKLSELLHIDLLELWGYNRQS